MAPTNTFSNWKLYSNDILDCTKVSIGRGLDCCDKLIRDGKISRIEIIDGLRRVVQAEKLLREGHTIAWTKSNNEMLLKHLEDIQSKEKESFLFELRSSIGSKTPKQLYYVILAAAREHTIRASEVAKNFALVAEKKMNEWGSDLTEIRLIASIISENSYISSEDRKKYLAPIIAKANKKLAERAALEESWRAAEEERKREELQKKELEKKKKEKELQEKLQTEQRKRASYRNTVHQRSITELIHFTRIENVRSILKHGILPRDKQDDIYPEPITNDSVRYDGHTDASCISVSFPNYKMLYSLKNQQPGSRWAVLSLSPDLLYDTDITQFFFFEKNAATKDTGRCTFEGMFGGKSGSDPADPQAEILAFGNIPPKYIRKIYVENSDDANYLYEHWVRDNVEVNRNYFSYRKGDYS